MLKYKNKLHYEQPIVYNVYNKDLSYAYTFAHGQVNVYETPYISNHVHWINDEELDVSEAWFKINNQWLFYTRGEFNLFYWHDQIILDTKESRPLHPELECIQAGETSLPAGSYTFDALWFKVILADEEKWIPVHALTPVPLLEHTPKQSIFRSLNSILFFILAVPISWILTLLSNLFSTVFNIYNKDDFPLENETVPPLDPTLAFLMSDIAYDNIDWLPFYPCNDEFLDYYFDTLSEVPVSSIESKLYSGYYLNEFSILQISGENDFQAIVFKHPSEMHVTIAFRGTDITQFGDVLTDFNCIFLGNSRYDGQIKCARHLASFFKNKGYQLSFTGHSLGGFIASVLAIEFNTKAVVFNAPGFKSFNYNKNKKKANLITQFKINQDIFVAKFGHSVGTIYNMDADPMVIDIIREEAEYAYPHIIAKNKMSYSVLELMIHRLLLPSTISAFIEAHYLENFFLHFINNSFRPIKFKE